MRHSIFLQKVSNVVSYCICIIYARKYSQKNILLKLTLYWEVLSRFGGFYLSFYISELILLQFIFIYLEYRSCFTLIQIIFKWTEIRLISLAVIWLLFLFCRICLNLFNCEIIRVLGVSWLLGKLNLIFGSSKFR